MIVTEFRVVENAAAVGPEAKDAPVWIPLYFREFVPMG
jgi:hypothetical protein